MSKEMSDNILAPNGGYCVHYPPNTFATRTALKIEEYHSDVPQLQLEHIQSRDTSRPITRKRKELMDYIEITSRKARAYGIFTRVGEVSEIERVSAANE